MVRNIKTKQILKIHLKGDLQIVALQCDNNKSTGYFIHILVAKIFVPNPNNYKYVMHIDDNNLNNKKSNLKWTNRRQNRNNKPIENENELWKQVTGLEDYEVSPNGYIRNKFSKKLLKGHLHGGYTRINIWTVLLATTFLGDPNQNETVDHIDRNKSNNKLENLEWFTMYNIQLIY